jgi:hypothetical protein
MVKVLEMKQLTGLKNFIQMMQMTMFLAHNRDSSIGDNKSNRAEILLI